MIIVRDSLYNSATEAERKELMKAFIERIDLYPEKRKDGCWIKKIVFNFPMPVEGGEVKELSLESETTVETVVLLSKGEIDSKNIRVEFSLEDMDMSEFQDGATYPQIKAYVLEHTGLKVSSLYISQVKRKCGLEVGKNYNLPKSEDARQAPTCPPEKENAIQEALKYFGMI